MFDDQSTSQSEPPLNLPSEPDDIFAGVEADKMVAGGPATPNALEAGLLKKRTVGAAAAMPAVDAMPATMMGMDKVAPPPVAYATKAPVLGKVIITIVVLAAIGGAGYGGFWIYKHYVKKDSPAITLPTTIPAIPTQQPTTQVVETPSVPEPVVSVPATATSSEATKATNDNILFGEQTDSDHDGLSDIEETNTYHTYPNNIDSDNDGLTDGEEVKLYHTNPSNRDSDNDGITDGDEVKKWHTDPNNPDTDGDGYSDGAEVKNGYNPVGPGKFVAPTTTTTTVVSTTPSSTPATSTKK